MIEVENINNGIIIRIKEEMELRNILKCNYDSIYNLPIKAIIRNSGDIIKSVASIQDIYLIDYNDERYIISKSDDTVYVSISKQVMDEIHENSLTINSEGIHLSKYIHDLNNSTLSTKFYPTKTKMFALDKMDAYETVGLITDKLLHLPNIEEVIDKKDIRSFTLKLK